DSVPCLIAFAMTLLAHFTYWLCFAAPSQSQAAATSERTDSIAVSSKHLRLTQVPACARVGPRTARAARAARLSEFIIGLPWVARPAQGGGGGDRAPERSRGLGRTREDAVTHRDLAVGAATGGRRRRPSRAAAPRQPPCAPDCDPGGGCGSCPICFTACLLVK